MSRIPGDWRGNVVWAGLIFATCAGVVGCGEPVPSSGVAHPVLRTPDVRSTAGADIPATDSGEGAAQPAAVAPPIDAAGGAQATAGAAGDPAQPRVFVDEGPAGALRINFDDLDLLKVLQMDPVTPDCVEKMPGWLKGLHGKTVRIRGYMKPGLLMEGIPQFVLVRDTGLCCFGPKGQVYHLIPVTLKQGITTDYIELKPFDVVGTFRIEPVQLDDGLIFQLYHIDDAMIIRK